MWRCEILPGMKEKRNMVRKRMVVRRGPGGSNEAMVN
jgi:hypothetical protein